MIQDDCEIKSVCNLDGAVFATGNASGFIKIYSVLKLEQLVVVQAHKSLIRNIVRVNAK